MVNPKTPNIILDIARKYAAAVQQKFQLTDLYLFGSYAKGTAHEDSDIDIAVVAKDFSGDSIDDTFSLLKLRRKVDLRIEPHPFLPSEFSEDHPFAREIIRTGSKIG